MDSLNIPAPILSIYTKVHNFVTEEPIAATICSIAMKALGVALVAVSIKIGFILIISAILGGILILGSLPIDVAIFKNWNTVKPKLKEIKLPDFRQLITDVLNKEK